MTQDNRPVLELVDTAKRPPRKIVPNKRGGNGGSGRGGNGGGNGGSGSSITHRFGDYFIKNGAFYQIKAVKDGPDGGGTVEFPLCDFTCRIVEEIITDNDLAENTFLRIEGRRANGTALPQVDVPVNKFYSTQGNWANEYWGTLPFIYPGAAKKDHLRACIHLFSQLDGEVPRRKIFNCTGWKKLDDQWYYLSGSGAITADGLMTGTEVDLGLGHMARYQLPAPLTGEPLKKAALEALVLLRVCPNKKHIGAALLAAIARAPLGECRQTDFAIWLHGLTGSRKSALAAIALAFFGNFTARTFPGNWSDSTNDAEAKSHQIKDGIFCMDDFKPSVSPTEASKLHAMAERLVRNTGNGAGRGRRDCNMQAKAAPFNRSLMIVTAEDLARGQSLLGRLLILELTGSDVDNTVLTRLQNAAEGGNFAGLMSAYLKWMAPRLDQLKKDFPKNLEAFRDAAVRDRLAVSHSRAPEIYGNLLAGTEVFLEFLAAVGAVTNEQSFTLLAEIETGLQQAFSEQGDYQKDQDEANRFIQLLQAALRSGNGHIACRLKQSPPALRPYAWGWRDAGSDEVGCKTYKPLGDCIGWYRDAMGDEPAEVWLQQDTAFKIAQQFARNQGETFLLSPASLWRRMFEKGMIAKTEPVTNGKPRLSLKRSVAGCIYRVMIVRADLLVAPAESDENSNENT